MYTQIHTSKYTHAYTNLCHTTRRWRLRHYARLRHVARCALARTHTLARTHGLVLHNLLTQMSREPPPPLPKHHTARRGVDGRLQLHGAR